MQKKTIGSLAVSSHGRKVRFPPEEIDTLAAVAKQAAVIIENARVYEREQRQRKQSETLSAVLTAATSTLSLREMLSKVMRGYTLAHRRRGVSIFLVDAVTGGSVPMMGAGRRQRGSLSKFLAALVRSDGALGSHRTSSRPSLGEETPLLIKDAATSPFISPWWVEKFGVKAVVAYLLIAKGKSIGAMIVDAETKGLRFLLKEIDALAPVARQVAVIIENARLYEHEQLQRQRTEKVSQALAPASATLSVRRACTAVCEAALQVTVGDQVSIFLHTRTIRHSRP